MKIIFLTSGSIKSNLTYRALALSRELQKNNHQIAIISPKADKYNDFKPEKVDLIDGINIIQPFQFITKHVELNLMPYIISTILIMLKERPDVVYIFKPTPISVVGLVAKIFTRATIILDLDDLGSEVMKIEGHPKHQQQLVAWCENIAMKYSDRITVASSYLSEMVRNRFPDKPIHLMPNGADDEWFAPVVFSEIKKRVVFMGSLNRRNIVEPLFDVWPNIIKRHPEACLLLIGDGKYLSYFKEKSKELGIDQSIRFTGWLPIEKAREILKAGDIGYNYMPDEPTIKAASNMKMSQYMARGVVPFVSNVGDLPAMISFGKAGYVCEANNIPELEKTLLAAIEDPQRVTIKATEARELASMKFSWNKLADNFDRWLNKQEIPDTTGRKIIYFITTNLPADTGGAEIRNFNLIKQLAKNDSVEISLFCIVKNNSDALIRKTEKDLGIKIYASPKPLSSIWINLFALINRVQPFMLEYKLSRIGDEFRAMCETEKPDVVQIEQIDAYYCIRPYIDDLRKNGVRVILDAHNVEAEAFRGAIQIFPFFKKMVGIFLLPPLRRLETKAAKNCDAIFTCSATDTDYFKKYNKNVYTIPNGVDCEQFFPVSKKDNTTIIFIGGVKYPPNADAVKFYLEDIHPQIKKAIPTVELLAIGTTREWMDSNRIKDDSVTPLGFVEDVKPYLDQAALGICPIRQGSGTRLKVLTFMAAGLPTVSTSKGAEGIQYTNGHDIIISDNAEDFVKNMIGLLSNPPRMKTLGGNSRELMLKKYDWNVIGKELNNAYQDIINE
jgi:glycosyltransferase involved in cell wall biosynthesis